MNDEGEVENAIHNYLKAIEISPEFVQAYNNLGIALKDKGDIHGAIDKYHEAITIDPNFEEAHYNLGRALSEKLSFIKPKTYLHKSILSLLKNGNFVRPRTIARTLIRLIKAEKKIAEILSKNTPLNTNSDLEYILDILNKFPLLLQLLKLCPIPDLELESLFSEIRRYLLFNNEIYEIKNEHCNVIESLAIQCFINEYIYYESQAERAQINNLIKKLKNLSQKEEFKKIQIACLASYLPLSKYNLLDNVKVESQFPELYKRTIIEPFLEKSILEEIPLLHKISDKISSKVKDQYEENPYPRWVSLLLSKNTSTIKDLIKINNLRLKYKLSLNWEKPAILIAGCGTGQHSISTAANYSNSNVTAVDLSLASLAYAKRKTAELGLFNLNYIQGDILDIKYLNKKFDIIECSGVLHHMKSPLDGWKELLSLLQPGGLMKVGLYSKIARKHLTKLKTRIIPKDCNARVDEIRTIRNKIINLNTKSPIDIIRWGDFFSMSEMRDLMFHVQEHQFTLLQINEMLQELNLSFCGIENVDIKNKFSKKYHEVSDLYDLNLWHEFEVNNPEIFTGMYQFWCQKKS